MKRLFYVLVVAVFMSLIVVGCKKKDNNITENNVKTDLETYSKTNILGENETIIEVSIVKQETKSEGKEKILECKVKTQDDQCVYEKTMNLSYDVEKNELTLSKVTVNNKKDWNVTPIAGIPDDKIGDSIVGTEILANGEIWKISGHNIKEIEIEKRDLNLEEKKDLVVVKVVIEDVLQEAKGQLTIEYIFEGEWKIGSIKGNDEFETLNKKESEPLLSDERIINLMNGHSFSYGVGKIVQDIVIKEEEVSEVEKINETTSEKGTCKNYEYSFVVSKKHADFLVTVEVVCLYKDEWDIAVSVKNAECTSIKIGGVWSGEMNRKACELNITDFTEDGTIVNGIYTYYNGEGSYYVSGSIDLKTLSLNMEPGEEIIVGTNWGNPYGTSRIEAVLNVEEGTISGAARRAFVVEQ